MRFQSGFGRSFYRMKTFITRAVTVGRLTGQVARCSGLALTLLVAPIAQAEPRPDAYESAPDHYASVREALQARHWATALGALQQLAREMPAVTDEAEYHNLTGFALRQHDASKLTIAIGHYQEALRIDPAHVQAREYLGQTHLLQGRTDLAVEQLQRIEQYCQGRSCSAWLNLHHAIEAAINRHAPRIGQQ
jgi:tetratricopeptide (TPR) repeat protein